MKIFLIPGYGVPDNIFEDENYNFYLKIAFNRIYNSTIDEDIEAPIIICSGGNTDMQEPYNRTEAGEMIKFLQHLADRPAVEGKADSWQFIAEEDALSTLENLLNFKKILQEKDIDQASITIFCEQTRADRIETLAEKILGEIYEFEVEPIDFDVSENRYLDSEFIEEKEQKELDHALWALESEDNLNKHHKLLEEKIEYLRESGPENHKQAVREWWEEKLGEVQKNN